MVGGGRWGDVWECHCAWRRLCWIGGAQLYLLFYTVFCLIPRCLAAAAVVIYYNSKGWVKGVGRRFGCCGQQYIQGDTQRTKSVWQLVRALEIWGEVRGLRPKVSNRGFFSYWSGRGRVSVLVGMPSAYRNHTIIQPDAACLQDTATDL